MKAKAFRFNLVYVEPAPPPPPDQTPPPPAPPKTFTQEQVNSLVAEERRKLEGKTKETIAKLETIQSQAKMTAEEKSALEAQLQELRNTLLSKEEILKREKETEAKSHAVALEKANKEAQEWRDRYTRAAIDRGIQDAAINSGAFNPLQILEMLGPKTRLAEEIGADGKPTGQLVPKTKFLDIKEGKPVELELSVSDALKRMQESTDRFGNLFKSTLASGLGGTNNPPAGVVDISSMSTEDYLKYRKKIKS